MNSATYRNEQGRVRLRRWGERTLDLDILLYGDQIIQNERLTVPHYDGKTANVHEARKTDYFCPFARSHGMMHPVKHPTN